MTAKSQVIRVFVCSPFRDMRAERSFLHEVVFPEVGRRLQRHGIGFEVVDPRRGADSEEEAEGLAGLETALADIDRCRPYFLGLLGENYGKTFVEVPFEVGRNYPALRHYARTARIHLETIHGVLNAPRQATHAYFYFRQPGLLDQIPEADRGPFLAASPADAHKLKGFKRHIGTTGRPVREYACRWDAQARRVVGLGAFGDQLAADLLDVLPEEERRLGLVPAAAPPPEPPRAVIPVTAPPSPVGAPPEAAAKQEPPRVPVTPAAPVPPADEDDAIAAILQEPDEPLLAEAEVVPEAEPIEVVEELVFEAEPFEEPPPRPAKGKAPPTQPHPEIAPAGFVPLEETEAPLSDNEVWDFASFLTDEPHSSPPPPKESGKPPRKKKPKA